MVPVQAIYESDLIAVLLQDSGYGQQTQRLAPFAISGEVIDPGVDK